MYILINKDLNRVRMNVESMCLWSGSFDVLAISEIEKYLSDPYLYKSKLMAMIAAWYWDGVVFAAVHTNAIIKWFKIYNEEK